MDGPGMVNSDNSLRNDVVCCLSRIIFARLWGLWWGTGNILGKKRGSRGKKILLELLHLTLDWPFITHSD